MRIKMKKEKNIIFGVIIVLAIFLISAGCSKEGGRGEAIKEQVLSVKGEEIVAVSKELKKSFTGSLEGEKQAVIRAKISEAVEKIHVKEGDYVKANDVIVSLDRSGPTSNFMQSYSVFQNAEKNFNKMKYLYEEGAVSESQYDGARTEYEVARANYEAALQMVELRAPISGMATSIDVSPGEYVSPGVAAATIATTDKLTMKFGVGGGDLGYFKEGEEVVVTVEAESLLVGKGEVFMVARSADQATRSFQIEARIDNKNGLFKPGMFGKAEITIGRYENIIAVPRSAILSRQNARVAFVYSGGKAVRREVITGVDFNGLSEVKSGLSVGDTLITVGQEYLEDGMKVNLVRIVDASGKEVEL
jgi:RND family efflux transporter MFP subunit